MNRNQKIAIGCGAAGCLGLIVLVIACVALYLMFGTSLSTTRRGNVNRSSSSSNSNSNSNSNSSTGEETSNSSISDDDKHKLFQAAGGAGDAELMQRVLRKLGFIETDGSQSAEYADFLKNHLVWAIKNREFIQSISTPEKARAYVEAHINDD
jgi:hypothetical protein